MIVAAWMGGNDQACRQEGRGGEGGEEEEEEVVLAAYNRITNAYSVGSTSANERRRECVQQKQRA